VRSGTHVSAGVGGVGDGTDGTGRVMVPLKWSKMAPDGVVPPSGDLI
jgi:hypothetical protein